MPKISLADTPQAMVGCRRRLQQWRIRHHQRKVCQEGFEGTDLVHSREPVDDLDVSLLGRRSRVALAVTHSLSEPVELSSNEEDNLSVFVTCVAGLPPLSVVTGYQLTIGIDLISPSK